MKKLHPRLILLGCLAVLPSGLRAAEPTDARLFGYPVVPPETVGFSSSRLARLDAAIQRTIDARDFAGVVTVAARHGKIFQCKTYGWKDLAAHTAMERDAIFRLHSMSKPITGVAMMMLYEEGRWHPQDPIARYIPEFAHLKVWKGFDAAGRPLLEEPEHPPTMRELMTHTAGFASGQGNAFGDRLYQDAQGQNRILAAGTLQEMIDRLAEVPLAYQPGSRWLYSISVDIQGYLVEKLSGQTFPEFVQRRIFEPLGMKDSGFYVPAEQHRRLAGYYERTDAGELRPVPESLSGSQDFTAPPTRPSGGGGMVSTAPDYLRFAQMLLNRGDAGGRRLLGPETVRMMSANHLGPELMSGKFGNGVHRMRPGLGFGFDFAVYTDPALADEPTGKGTFMWLGAAGTIFWVDPANDLIFVGMVQRSYNQERPDLEEITRQTLYQALIHPEL